MGMDETDALAVYQSAYFALHLWVKCLAAFYDMALHTPALKAAYHLAIGKRETYGFETLFVEEVYQIKQVRLAAAYLSLAYHFQNFHRVRSFFELGVWN